MNRKRVAVPGTATLGVLLPQSPIRRGAQPKKLFKIAGIWFRDIGSGNPVLGSWYLEPDQGLHGRQIGALHQRLHRPGFLALHWFRIRRHNQVSLEPFNVFAGTAGPQTGPLPAR